MGQAQAIFERLESDHDEHRELLDKIENTSGASSERASLFEKLTKDIKSHAVAEEQALYATMLRKPRTTDDTRHSVAEHHELDEMLNDIAATEMSSSQWLSKFKDFKHRYLHHIEEEEEDHFPDFEKHLTEDDEKTMRAVFDQRKSAELETAKVTPEAAEEAKD